MRILLSAYACAPDMGSEPGIGWNWALTLAQQGQRVCCLTNKNYQQKITQKLQTQPVSNLEIVFVGVWNWLEFMRRKFPFPFVYIHYLVWQYKAYKIAKGLHERIPFDLVHHVSYGSVQLSSHMWKLGLPFIFGPVGGGERVPRSLRKYIGIGWFREIGRGLTEFVMIRFIRNVRRCMEQASLVLVTNLDTYNWAKEYGAAEVRYFLDMGIHPPELPANHQPMTSHSLSLLWVGKMVAKKGLGLVLDGLKEASNNNILLTVVGDGPLLRYYRWKVRRLGLTEQVRFVGYQSYDNLKALYATHHALVYTPLRSAFGGQLLEALSHRLPVITLDIHGASKFVSEEVGFKLKLGSKQEVGETMNYIYGHPEEYGIMKEKTDAFARQHTWKNKTSEMIQIYQEVYESSRFAPMLSGPTISTTAK